MWVCWKRGKTILYLCLKATAISCTVPPFSGYIFSFPAGWALSCCNKTEETQIFVHVAHINPCAQNLFLESCQLWLRLIWCGCFLIIADVQRSDLNKSATGTEVPPLHLLIAIVSPWKVFQNTAVVFSLRGKCVDGFHSNADMGGAVGANACEMCWRNKQALKTNEKRDKTTGRERL